jgi:hypothetical protein
MRYRFEIINLKKEKLFETDTVEKTYEYLNKIISDKYYLPSTTEIRNTMKEDLEKGVGFQHIAIPTSKNTKEQLYLDIYYTE